MLSDHLYKTLQEPITGNPSSPLPTRLVLSSCAEADQKERAGGFACN